MAHLGHYISGAGHAGLIGFVLVGPLFSSEPLPFETVNVSVVSASEFAALSDRPTQVALPDAPEAPAAPAAPAPETAPPPEPTPDAPRAETPPPAPPSAPTPEAAVPTPPPPPAPVETPQTETPSLVTPDALAQSEPPAAPEVSERPAQRPSERIAPTPEAPPEPEADRAPERQEALAPEPAETAAPEPVAPQEATAPEEAASEIVTEAEEAARTAAPRQSARPQLRPQRLAAAAPPPSQTAPDAPEEEVAPQPAPTPPPAETDDTAAAIEDALRQALTGGEAVAPAPSGPTGPPLTAGEREGLVLAVQSCWIIDPGSPASEVVVTVGMTLTPEGRVQGDVRRVSAVGGDARAQEVAFQAARRAVLRCSQQQGGFDLPPEKYAQWEDVEMTFNPESMRIR